MHNDDDVDVVVAAAVVAYKECSRLNAPAALCQAKVGLTPRPHTNIKEFVACIQQKKLFSSRPYELTKRKEEKQTFCRIFTSALREMSLFYIFFPSTSFFLRDLT